MQAIAGCLIYIAIVLAISAAVNALLAIPITWALNSFTPFHLTYLTVFVILCIVGVVFGGSVRRTK